MRVGAALVCLVVLCSPPQADAQTFELWTFSGYRVGGDFYEVAVGQPVDTDGAHSVGLLVDLWLPHFTAGPHPDGPLHPPGTAGGSAPLAARSASRGARHGGAPAGRRDPGSEPRGACARSSSG